MTDINSLLLEGLDRPVRNFIHDVKYNPNRAANNAINIGSLAAALYHIYANSKDKEDKISAAINALPAAAMKGLAVALAGHTLKDLAKGDYSYDPMKNPMYTKNPGMRPNPSHMNNYQMNSQQRQFIQNLLGTKYGR